MSSIDLGILFLGDEKFVFSFILYVCLVNIAKDRSRSQPSLLCVLSSPIQHGKHK